MFRFRADNKILVKRKSSLDITKNGKLNERILPAWLLLGKRALFQSGNWSTLLRQYQLRKRNCFDAILVELAFEIFTFASSYRGSFIDKNIIVISFHSQDDG